MRGWKFGIPVLLTFLFVFNSTHRLQGMDPVSDIRQRRKEEDNTSGPSTQSFTKKLEKLDIYPKIGDDYVIKTESGGFGIFESLA